jgi:hypothetical protein
MMSYVYASSPRELTVDEVDDVAGAGPFGVIGAGLGGTSAALGALALFAAPEIVIPLGVAAGVYGILGGAFGLIDAL